MLDGTVVIIIVNILLNIYSVASSVLTDYKWTTYFILLYYFEISAGTSLVAQWLKIRLPMQGMWVRALVRDDPTYHGATKPVSHNNWSPCAYSPCSATREATTMRSPHTTMKSSPRSPQLEEACMQQWRPNASKNK